MGILLIYSYRFNTRLTEYSTYALWTTALFRLIDAKHYFAVAPQYEIYVSPLDATLPTDPDASIMTQADRKARGVYLDLAIILHRIAGYDSLKAAVVDFIKDLSLQTILEKMTSRYQPMLTSMARIDSVHVAVIVELKRPPSRHAPLKRWLHRFFNASVKATAQATTQAMLLFLSPRYSEQNEVVLIAGIGDWFLLRIISRRHFRDDQLTDKDVLDQRSFKHRKYRTNADDIDESESEDEEEVEVVMKETSRQHVERAERAARRGYQRVLRALGYQVTNTSADPTPELERRLPPFTDEELDAGWVAFDFPESGPPTFLQPQPLSVNDINENMLRKQWTGFMRLGSPTADLYLQFVKKRLDVLGQNAVRDLKNA